MKSNKEEAGKESDFLVALLAEYLVHSKGNKGEQERVDYLEDPGKVQTGDLRDNGRQHGYGEHAVHHHGRRWVPESGGNYEIGRIVFLMDIGP